MYSPNPGHFRSYVPTCGRHCLCAVRLHLIGRTPLYEVEPSLGTVSAVGTLLLQQQIPLLFLNLTVALSPTFENAFHLFTSTLSLIYLEYPDDTHTYMVRRATKLRSRCRLASTAGRLRMSDSRMRTTRSNYRKSVI
jgi:hypothetical protein